jgi:hypothetical protein
LVLLCTDTAGHSDRKEAVGHSLREPYRYEVPASLFKQQDNLYDTVRKSYMKLEYKVPWMVQLESVLFDSYNIL